MKPNTKLWRESASLIILAKNNYTVKSPGDYNYKILMLQRSGRGFFPNSTVFPGGVIDPKDASRDWLNLYKSVGVLQDNLEKIKSNGNKPPIFDKKPQELQREISLRISGIRETFEELGILICKDAEDIKKQHLDGPFSTYKSGIDTAYWQKKVHNNPQAFFELCQHHKIVPDLWGTHEWATWLTPTLFDKRFDTAFFFVALTGAPDVLMESSEVKQYHWRTPRELLAKYQLKQLYLPPPQFYELLRLLEVTDIDEIATFAKDRESKGLNQMYPIQIRAKDGIIHVLPGDYLYPKEPNFELSEAKDETEFSIEELRLKANGALHRFEGLNSLRVGNFKSSDGHLLPQSVHLS